MLMVEVGQFFRADAAHALAARLPGARISQQGRGRNAVFRVSLGPFADVAAADLALERTLAAGVSGSRIVLD
jgi:cell division septation protein DedD